MAKKIKVLQLCAVDSTVKFLLKPLIDKLEKTDYDVWTACSYGKYTQELKQQGYKIKSIEIKRRVLPVSNLISLWRIYKFIKKEKFDIVHVHTPITAIIGRIVAKFAHTPIIIYTAHGFYFHENMPFLKRKFHVWLEKFLGQYFTDMLFTQSKEDALTAIKEKIVPKNKVVWISNGVDITKFNIPPDKKLKCALGFNKNDKIIGFIGRLTKEKGVEDLFSAMKEVVKTIPQTKLLIIGETLESDREGFNKKIIKKYNLEKNIIFTGFSEDIANLLSIIDLFVLPSLREGMPRSILEAMASNKPVVTTNIRGCREEVVDDETGLLVPIKDPEALGNAITKILSNPELVKKMGENGRKRVIKNFDEKMVLEKELKIYQQLINEKL